MKKFIIISMVLCVGLVLFMMNINKKHAQEAEQRKQAYEAQQRQNELDAQQRAKERADRAAQEELEIARENEAVKAKQAEAEKAQIQLSQEAVKQLLIDPSSAQFRNQTAHCGEVNAKNKMGGYTGYSRYIVRPEANMVVLNTPDDILISEGMWKQFCP